MPDYLAWWLWFGFWFSGVWMVKTIASCRLAVLTADVSHRIYEAQMRRTGTISHLPPSDLRYSPPR